MIHQPDAIIIGSGPSGYVALYELTKNGFHCLLVEESDHEERSGEKEEGSVAARDADQIRVPYPKAERGSYGIYFHDPNWHVDRHILAARSRGRGGFSRVWGGVIDPQFKTLAPLQIESLTLGEVQSPGRKKLTQVLQKGFQDSSWVVVPSEFALNKNAPACENCGECLEGCPLKIIWDSREPLEQLLKEDRDLIHPGTVEKIEKKENSWKVRLETGEVLSASAIFLAAGALGSATILKNSGLVNKEVSFLEHQHFAFVAFSLKKIISDNISLSAVSIFDSFKKSFYLQIYPFVGRTLREQLVMLVGPHFVNLTDKVWQRHFLLIQGFLADKHSQRIVMTDVGDGSYRLRVVNRWLALLNCWLVFFKTAVYFLKSGFIPIPILATSKVGGSFHLRAENLPTLGGLYYVDANGLECLPMGPPSLHIMRSAQEKAKRYG